MCSLVANGLLSGLSNWFVYKIQRFARLTLGRLVWLPALDWIHFKALPAARGANYLPSAGLPAGK